MDSSGERDRFEAVALPLLTLLYRYALRLSGDVETARDLVQETCLRAYRTFENFRTGTNIKAWLFTILYSIFVNRYRRQRLEPKTMSLEEIDLRFQSSFKANDRVPNIGEGTSWSDAEVGGAVEELPERLREAVLRVDIEGLTYEEAAAALNCPIGTVRSRLNRARKLLFCALEDHAHRVGYLREGGLKR
jgi:RNA polymerase sigma-70 factor (ECF subfamily)